MTTKQRIEELERRVRELEARPLQVIGIPYFVPPPVAVPNPWPLNPPIVFRDGPWSALVPESMYRITSSGN